MNTLKRRAFFVLVAVATGVALECSRPVIDGGDDAMAEDADATDSSVVSELHMETYSGTVDADGGISVVLPGFEPGSQELPMIQLYIERALGEEDPSWYEGLFTITEDGMVRWGPISDAAGRPWRMLVIR